MRKISAYMMIFVLAVIFLLTAPAYGSVLRIYDAEDRLPVGGATVVGADGIILGMTGMDGKIDISSDAPRPLTVKCIGYQPAECGEGVTDVAMTPAVYDLAEVEVNAVGRPITRVLAFGREYCTGVSGRDTMQLYAEYMVESFFADGKVKGYHKSDSLPGVCNVRYWGRVVNSKEGTDSVFRPHVLDDITAISWFTNMMKVPYRPTKMPASMAAGASADTVAGKFGPRIFSRKSGNLFIKEINPLADHENHRWSPWFFKLFGMTMELYDARWSLAYRQNDKGVFDVYDFVYGTCSLGILGKGRIFRKMLGIKEPLDMNCYMEIYPVDITRITVDDYKAMRKERYERVEPFRTPANLQPLEPAVMRMIERVDRESPLKKSDD